MRKGAVIKKQTKKVIKKYGTEKGGECKKLALEGYKLQDDWGETGKDKLKVVLYMI